VPVKVGFPLCLYPYGHRPRKPTGLLARNKLRQSREKPGAAGFEGRGRAPAETSSKVVGHGRGRTKRHSIYRMCSSAVLVGPAP